MMDEHEDPKFNEWLRREARSYHSPPPTPREQMWARIVAGRRRRHILEIKPWMTWALAAAAVLAVGIGIGRWSANQAADTTASPPRIAAAESDVVYQVAATQYMSRAEAFLTGFRADMASGTANGRFVRQARDLLTTTRFLLDSPASDDPRVRALLQDLELVLVQISELEAGAAGARDADLITQGMNQTNVLPKLRSAIPAGPVAARTEGVL